MNKSALLFIILAFVTGQFIACTKDASNPSLLPVTASNISGNFTVNSFTSSSANQTALFAGYQFAFSENGTVAAVKDSTTYNGTWRFDDSDNSELKLSFNTAPLSELNKGWHIAELTTEHMLLSDDDDSDEAGDDNPSSHEKLEFKRI